MKKSICIAFAAILLQVPAARATDVTDISQETPIFITIGQSNADGTAIFNADEDARLNAWYDSESNPGLMKMWYRSCYINTSLNNKCWCFDGTVDVEPGWLNLWYRNENKAGRTAMNMHSHYGTWPTDDNPSNGCNRRGMEGQFGMRYQTAYPDKELYVIKLGCGGSAIATWTSDDNHNWEYFYNNMYKPAMADLLSKGKKPRLAGVWWMQGCKDRNNTKEYYLTHLKELIEKIRTDLGFPEAKIYIGHIVKPGENPDYPTSSKQFGQTVRDAQDAVTTPGNDDYIANTEIIDGRDCPFESDELHWNHVGVNKIGDKIADRVIADGPEKWASFATPGKWRLDSDGNPLFSPAIGTPEITYSTDGDRVTATLKYDTWSETKTVNKSDIPTGDIIFEGEAIYVKAEASGSGLSWDDAIGKIDDAVAKASDNGVKNIFVANGRYSLTETLKVPAGMNIVGGFDGDGDATVVTTSGTGDILTLNEGTADSYALIKGLTVTGAKSGRGVTAYSFSRIYNCIIENNHTTGKTRGTDDGAGIWLGENTMLSHSIIRDNEAANYTGGGVSIDGSNITIKNCLITGNISRKAHKTNGGTGAGGILHWIARTNNKVVNTTITNNQGLDYGGLWVNGTSGSCKWLNCVIWGNRKLDGTEKELSNINAKASMTFKSTYSPEMGNVTDGITLLSKENSTENGPRFTAPENSDYTLAQGSPLIDAGSDPDYGDGLDYEFCLAGNPRRQGNAIDVGAYESNHSSAIGTVIADPAFKGTEYYNLQGIKVSGANLQPGIYIKRSASGTRKVIVTR